MKFTKNKKIWVKTGYFLLVLLFILVFFGQFKLVSAIFLRIVRVIVGWVEKGQSGVETPKKLEFTSFLKDFVNPPPSTSPVLSCTGVRVHIDAVYAGNYADLKPGFYTIGDDPGYSTCALVDSSTGICTGICNDTISSATVGQYCIAMAYANSAAAVSEYSTYVSVCNQHTTLWDRSSFCSDVANLGDIGVDNAISGLRINTGT